MLLVSAFLAAAVWFHPEALRAPAWVAYLAASLLALAGSVALARAWRRPVLADALVCLVLAGMLLVGVWVSCGRRVGQRFGRLPGTSVAVSAVSEATCRSAFGVGAFMVAVMLALAVRGWLRRRSEG